MPNNNEDEYQDKSIGIQVINRILRRKVVCDRPGEAAVLEQLEISPLPLRAVVVMALSITVASIQDFERRRRRIPLSYKFNEAYLLANKGAKNNIFNIKSLAEAQISAQVEQETESMDG